ncbi:unnamed protein product, partial [Sphacelaria rigidula]
MWNVWRGPQTVQHQNVICPLLLEVENVNLDITFPNLVRIEDATPGILNSREFFSTQYSGVPEVPTAENTSTPEYLEYRFLNILGIPRYLEYLLPKKFRTSAYCKYRL